MLLKQDYIIQYNIMEKFILKYGIVIAMTVAITFVGCTITLVKHQKKETTTEFRFGPVKKDTVKKNKVGVWRGIK